MKSRVYFLQYIWSESATQKKVVEGNEERGSLVATFIILYSHDCQCHRLIGIGPMSPNWIFLRNYVKFSTRKIDWQYIRKSTYGTQFFKAELCHSLVYQMLAIHWFLGGIWWFKKGQSSGHVIFDLRRFMSF